MKSKLFFIFVNMFLLAAVYTMAQPTFKTLLDRGESLGTVIIPVDSGYLLAEYGNWSAIIKIDTSGNIIYTNVLKSYHSFSYGQVGSKSFLLNSGNNNVNMCFLGQNKQFYLCLGSMNHKTKSFNWIKGYNIVDTIFLFSAANFPVTLNYAFNNGTLISTSKRTDSLNLQKFPLMVSTDSLGNVQNSYRINEHYGVAMFTHQTDDHSYISGINFTGDTMGTSLVSYDTTGQVKWAKTYFGNKSLFYSSVKNGDGSLTIIGSPDSSYNGTFRSQRFLMKVDTTGNTLWCKLFGDSIRSFKRVHGCQLKDTDDGGYIITGFTCDTAVTLYTGSDLIIIKTDSNGDTLWTRTHGNAYTEDGGQDITQTSDGGYIVCGYSSSAQFDNGGYLIIKTDSLGMTDTHCQEFNLPIAVSNVVPPDSAITLTITTGLISSVPSSVNDTTYTIQQKNGCWLSAVGVEEQTSSATKLFTAVPNPNHGVFTLVGNGEFSGLKIFIGIDILGHELFQSQSDSQNPSFDLSSYPSGIYFIKIIGDGRVDVVKVVLHK